MDDCTAFGYRPFIPAARPACEPAPCEPARGGRTGLSTAVPTAGRSPRHAAPAPPVPFPGGLHAPRTAAFSSTAAFSGTTAVLADAAAPHPYPQGTGYPDAAAQDGLWPPAAAEPADAVPAAGAHHAFGAWPLAAPQYPAGAPEAEPDPAEPEQDPYAPGLPGHPDPYGERNPPDGQDPCEPELPAGPDRLGEDRPGGPPKPRGHRRRRHRAARSAVFTLAVPSAAFLGVTAAAVAGVAATHGGQDRSAATASNRPPARLGPRPARRSALGQDSAPAGRDQPRADLEQREEAQRRQAMSEAAQRERARPRFALPVDERGLSAYFGQVGLNWMSFHTGIDFPVDVGTPVRAATDGRVSTAWSPAYGNIVKVTAPDGTQTWYCHLSRARVRSGAVQAGEVIAYSGNTGNTTGPHLHFEVRPAGGDPVNPLPWLLGHNLDPR